MLCTGPEAALPSQLTAPHSAPLLTPTHLQFLGFLSCLSKPKTRGTFLSSLPKTVPLSVPDRELWAAPHSCGGSAPPAFPSQGALLP